MKKTHWLIILFLMLAMVLVACGGDAATGDSAPEQEPAEAETEAEAPEEVVEEAVEEAKTEDGDENK